MVYTALPAVGYGQLPVLAVSPHSVLLYSQDGLQSSVFRVLSTAVQRLRPEDNQSLQSYAAELKNV
jgi:hypothetical protein